MAQRADLPIEGPITLDGSGNYQSAWIDSAGIKTVGAVYTSGTQGVQIDYSSDGSTVLLSDGWSNLVEKPVLSRYFRLSIFGGTPSAVVNLSVRVTERC